MKFWGWWSLALGLALAACGCGTSYAWRSSVPVGHRTVSVPTFVNHASAPEFGAVVTRQVLREFQREGTFKLEDPEDAAVELQGEVVMLTGLTVAVDRHGSRRNPQQYRALVRVTAIDRRNQRILFENREYSAQASTSAGGDTLNAKRDVYGRLADELSRMIVDDVLNYKW